MNCEYEGKFLNAHPGNFETLALDVFRFQYENNAVYRSYCDILQSNPENVYAIEQVPFLPIQFFKQKEIKATAFEPELIFESSGTTGENVSRHFVRYAAVYDQSFLKGFKLFYGDVEDWCILGLLPAYLERKNSSLVYMVDRLIRLSGHPLSGFYLYDHQKLIETLKANEASGQKTLLIGVTFALLDLAAAYPLPLKHTTIMETGGMKGRGKELIREEVHNILRKSFSVPVIHAEYGMTELLSQAYSQGNGLFRTVPWMKIMLREEDDPFNLHPTVKNGIQHGLINIIDLANIYSCSFIATDDIGRLHSDGSFEVLGRMDHADVRGCSLMVTNVQ